MQKVIIKKKSNKNEYLLTEDKIWVRDFCKTSVPKIDINDLSNPKDYSLFIQNELENSKTNFMDLDSVNTKRQKVVIVSDGYDFKNKQKLLSKLKSDVTIMGVNKSLNKWDLVGNIAEKEKKAMAFYVINNPYPEAVNFLPKKKYYPKCVASTRTNPEFLKFYKGPLYGYSPVPEIRYGSPNIKALNLIDDYRNPICAAIGIAYSMGAVKIMLFCCDNSFDEQRSGAVQLENGLWHYPQHALSSHIIDANLYWLKKKEIEIANFSSGPKLNNATYINDEAGMFQFFED